MRKTVVCLTAIIVLALALTACGGVDKIDISEYADKTVSVSGLADAPFEMTVKELSELECVTVSASGINQFGNYNDKIGTVRATGPYLKTLAKKYGAELTDFANVVITSTDGYNETFKTDFLVANDIILSFGWDGKPLKSGSAPVRLVIPDGSTAQWISGVASIEFVK